MSVGLPIRFARAGAEHVSDGVTKTSSTGGLHAIADVVSALPVPGSCYVRTPRTERWTIVTRPLHFGVTLPQIKRSWSEARAAAVEFDELGYDSVWVCDHVYGVPLPTLPIFEAWTELAAVAAVTERVQLGTLVTPPFFRNPGLLAKQIATVDHVAGGRVIVGLGAGWFQPEFEGYGLPFPGLGERMVALDELAQILPRLFSDERTTFEGRHFQLRDAICEPKPPRRPPILIGGGGERVLMGIAARHADIWNNLAVFQPQLEQKIEALRRRCDQLERDPATIEISQQCVVVIAADDDGARQALAKAQKIYGGHMGAGLEEHGIWGDPQGVIDRIERHRALGCTTFLMEFFGRDTRAPAKLFAEKVLPHFRSA
jgi:alkanesulfonate monooxygenase SsuD/methylene tetrahydromethanopterin reductase-like flavin-dependent oxidoreductase (luciferase family)